MDFDFGNNSSTSATSIGTGNSDVWLSMPVRDVSPATAGGLDTTRVRNVAILVFHLGALQQCGIPAAALHLKAQPGRPMSSAMANATHAQMSLARYDDFSRAIKTRPTGHWLATSMIRSNCPSSSFTPNGYSSLWIHGTHQPKIGVVSSGTRCHPAKCQRAGNIKPPGPTPSARDEPAPNCVTAWPPGVCSAVPRACCNGLDPG